MIEPSPASPALADASDIVTRDGWPAVLLAAGLGYSFAVALSVSLLATIAYGSPLVAWDMFYDSLVSNPAELVEVVLFPAGLQAIAGGVYLLARSRIGRHRPLWTKTLWLTLASGGAAWLGVMALLWLLVVMTGVNASMQREFLLWLATGPLCFAAGILAAEALLKASRVT